MSRKPWSETELADLQTLPDWRTFHAFHPRRSYDSWEVKRRRVAPSGRQHEDSNDCWCAPLVIHVGAPD